MANVIGCNIVGSKFKLQSQYYVHFWTNTLEYLMLKLSKLDEPDMQG